MSSKVTRQVIKIDEEKCNGCGQCVEACHEGAIQMIDGKARLVSDIYCDGLGDCIGECPQDAISFETREADPYDEKAVQERMKQMKGSACSSGGCPGSMARGLTREGLEEITRVSSEAHEKRTAELANWPVQMKLVPVNAPYLRNANIVFAADCTAFSYGDFHRDFLKGENRVCLIGCPKLDDRDHYREKLAQIIELNDPRSITVVYMEVPCCGGLVKLVESAIETARNDIDLKLVKIGVKGDVLAEETVRYRYS